MWQPTHQRPVYHAVTVLLHDGPLLCGFNVAIKGLINKNIATAIRSCPASCSTFASYHRYCHHDGRWLLITSSDGRTRLTTAAVWRQSRTGGRINISTHVSTFDARMSSGAYGEDLNERKEKEKWVYIAPFCEHLAFKALRCGSHSFVCK